MSRPLSSERRSVAARGLLELPSLERLPKGRNGEELDTDEAAIWKRVISYRLATFLKPKVILETHPGLGVSTDLFKAACPEAEIVSCKSSFIPKGISLIDVDPFGQPWQTIETVLPYLANDGVLMVSTGEAYAVVRNWKRAMRIPTDNTGVAMPKWVVHELLPSLELLTEAHAKFFYAFPTTIRIVLSRRPLPKRLWSGCPQWMWWLEKYSKNI